MIAILICLALTCVELGSAALAKRALDERSLPFGLAGAASFVLLFGIYMLGLAQASLTFITVGWIVFSQIGAVAMDIRFYGAHFTIVQYVGISIILAGVLVLCLPTTSP